MARFHLDEDINPALKDELVRAGHVAVTARQLGMLAAPDGAHLLSAALDQRILVTRNRKDFLLLHDAWNRWMAAWLVAQSVFLPQGLSPTPMHHPGILIIPQAWPPTFAAQEINGFAQQHPAFPGELYAWEPQQGWMRHV